MINKKLVSVLIPSYNHEKYIREALGSVLSQTYTNIELIVIDDGSKDKTWQIINELKADCEKKFKKVIFERQENKGTAYTFNKVYTKATGDYIYILASDDTIKPTTIEKLCNFLSANEEYGLAVGNNELIDNDSKIIYWDAKRNTIYPNKGKYKYKNFAELLQEKRKDVDFHSKNFGTYETLLKSNYIPNGYMIRKSIMEKVGGYDIKAPLEDWYLMMQISKISKIKYIDDILFSYRWHDENSVKRVDKMKQLTIETFRYEVENVLSGKNKKHKKIVESFLENNGKKNFIKLGNIINFYKIKNLLYKEYICKIFGKTILKKRIAYK